MATKQLFNTVLFIALLFLLPSCDLGDDEIDGNDKVETEIRNIASFDEIESLGDFDVYITLADSTSIRVEAEENLLEYIETDVNNYKLVIEEKNGYSLDNNDPMRIYLTTPNLDEAVLAGSGLIQCDSLSGEFFQAVLLGSGKIDFSKVFVDNVEARITGSGDIELEGEGKVTDYEIEGGGDIRAIDFIHEDSESRIIGDGNIYVHATDHLRARIVGSGNIYYEANPDVDDTVTGTGDVRRY